VRVRDPTVTQWEQERVCTFLSSVCVRVVDIVCVRVHACACVELCACERSHSHTIGTRACVYVSLVFLLDRVPSFLVCVCG